MIDIKPGSTRSSEFTDGIEDGAVRLGEALESVAKRAEQVLDSIDVDADRLVSDARETVATVIAGERAEPREMKAARDDERLKSAIIAGIVLFVGSAIVFLVARQIVMRRAEDRRRTQAHRQGENGRPGPVEPPVA